MLNLRKRISTNQENWCDEVDTNEHSTSLTPPPRKKVKEDRDDTERLEKTIVERNSSVRDEETFDFSDDLRDNLYDNSGGDFHNLTTDDVFKRIGLSQKTQDTYRKERNISNLYDWQKECITHQKLLKGENYILSLQTGAGKTLIAELLMLRETLVKNRSCIIILPYKAIVQEKILSLSAFEELDIFVEEYAGSKGRIPPVKRRKGQTIYVATIEKGNILINSLIKANRLMEIGLVVIDELHMIGEKGRGVVIEQLLFKYLMFGSGQIVGMSATLGDVHEMCKFMKANHFSSDFRPVKLIERAKIGDSLYDINSEGDLVLHSKMKTSEKVKKTDPDDIVSLIKDIVPQKSVIIFCPTKKNCENVCKMVTKLAPKSFKTPNSDREEIIDNIKNENDGDIEGIMENGIRAGIAYHHSGLSSEERHWIETAFQNGTLYALCATSTLAAGVNLPARRVIIKQPQVGIDFLGKSQYLQMIGRSGRAGYDDKGESITIVGPPNAHKFKDMLKSPLDSCKSQMLDLLRLEGFLLDLIYLKLVEKLEQLPYFLSKTLAGIQKNEECLSLLEKSVGSLIAKDMVKIEDGMFKHTVFGEATFVANFSPDCAKLLNANLLKDLTSGVVFSTHFHLVLLLIPYDIGCVVNWDLFHDEFKKLDESEKQILSKVDIQESDILRQITIKKRAEKGTPSMRLYIAFIMMDIWNKMPVSNVAKKYNLQKGWIQNTLHSVCSQAQRIQRFSELLENLWPLKLLLPFIIEKLKECKNIELLPLMNLDCVKFGRAKMLYDKGFKTVKSIADAKPGDLLSCIGQISLAHAKRIIKSAKTAIDQMLINQEEERISYGLSL
uniref:Mutagen-sensitive 301 (inferred by orthology to a D. melanogaster protein) n=1 Tax=Strongyloides venezuelensis TaxID=75913 RepID=A0A0K0FSY6_STRVS